LNLASLIHELKIRENAYKNIKKRTPYSDEEIKQEADKYQHLSDWQKGHRKTYMSAWRQARVAEFSKHMTKKARENIPREYGKGMSPDEIQLEANKYKYRSDWQRKSRASYLAAFHSLGIDHFAKHMVRKPIK